MGTLPMLRVSFAYIYPCKLLRKQPGHPASERRSGTLPIPRRKGEGDHSPPATQPPPLPAGGATGHSAPSIYAWVSALWIPMSYSLLPWQHVIDSTGVPHPSVRCKMAQHLTRPQCISPGRIPCSLWIPTCCNT